MALSPATVAAADIRLIPFRSAGISLQNKYVGKQFLDNTGDKRKSINAYFVQDLRFDYTVEKWLAKEIHFIFQLNNLWNKKYESNGYTYTYIYDNSTITENFYYPMAGRNILAAININF